MVISKRTKPRFTDFLQEGNRSYRLTDEERFKLFIKKIKLSEAQIAALFKFTEFQQIKTHRLFAEHRELHDQLTEFAKFLLKDKKFKSYKNIGAYTAAMREAPGYFIVMLWYLVGIPYLEPYFLLACTSFLTALTLWVIAKVKTATYLKIEEEEQQSMDDWMLLSLQHAYADWVLQKNKKTYKKVNNKKTLSPVQLADIEREAIETACIVGLTAYTYYMSYVSVIVALELAAIVSLLTTTVALALALVGSLMMGMYCGNSNYENSYDQLNDTLEKENSREDFKCKYAYILIPKTNHNVVNIKDHPSVKHSSRAKYRLATNPAKLFAPAAQPASSVLTVSTVAEPRILRR